jgi:hypothetical protein
MKESESEVLKIEESESELLCTDSTALLKLTIFLYKIYERKYLASYPFLAPHFESLGGRLWCQ